MGNKREAQGQDEPSIFHVCKLQRLMEYARMGIVDLGQETGMASLPSIVRGPGRAVVKGLYLLSKVAMVSPRITKVFVNPPNIRSQLAGHPKTNTPRCFPLA